jgi:hypothetical protein
MSADTQVGHPALFERLPTRWKHHTASARFRMETLVIIALAGAAAQRVLADRVLDPAHAEHEEQIAANVVRPFTRSERELAAYVAWLKVRAEDLVRERWTAVRDPRQSNPAASRIDLQGGGRRAAGPRHAGAAGRMMPPVVARASL